MTRIKKNESHYYMDDGVPVIVTYLNVPKNEMKFLVEDPSGLYRIEKIPSNFKKISKGKYISEARNFEFSFNEEDDF